MQWQKRGFENGVMATPMDAKKLKKLKTIKKIAKILQKILQKKIAKKLPKIIKKIAKILPNCQKLKNFINGDFGTNFEVE